MPVIAGADECGYGSLAGPMVICGAVADTEAMKHMRCRDSKRYTNPAKMVSDTNWDRARGIRAEAIYSLTPLQVCRLGYNASRALGFHVVAYRLRQAVSPYFPKLIVDGEVDFGVQHSQAIVRADDKVRVVSYASVVGKLFQKAAMNRAHLEFPEYQFDKHAGYGTQAHIAAMRKHGVVPGLHRITVIAKMFRGKGWKMHTRSEWYEE